MVDNKNPYHIYNDLEQIKTDTETIEKEVINNNLTLPVIKGVGTRIWNYNWYCKIFGFNTCQKKEDLKYGFSVPSLIWRGELQEATYTEPGKLRKNGTPYPRKKWNPVYCSETNKWIYYSFKGKMEYISKDIQSFWEFYNTNRQISSGLTHNDRWVIVGDFDCPFTNHTIQDLEKICLKYTIPHFTYLERHMDTNHFQIGWILNEPFYKGNYNQDYMFRDTIRSISTIFGSDPNFTGWNIKNPNCLFETETMWFNDTVDRNELVQAVQTTRDAFFPTKETNIILKEKKPNLDTSGSSEIETYVNKNSSRNITLFNELRRWYKDYYSENKTPPSYEQTYIKGQELSDSIGRLTQKGSLPDSEIRKTVGSIENHFRFHKVSNMYSKRQSFGNLVRGTRKEDNILKVCLLRNQGLKINEIMKELGLKRDSVNKYISYIKKHYPDRDLLIPNTLKLAQHTSSHMNNKYADLITSVLGNMNKIEFLSSNRV